jgi:NAD(P)-dependent dehydrogenase (short-subunit alcohol dehydrogenase family)
VAVALITGCSSGFGEAIVVAFAARVDTVVASMRRCEDASAALRSTRGVSCLALDVTNALQRHTDLADRRDATRVVVASARMFGSSHARRRICRRYWLSWKLWR